MYKITQEELNVIVSKHYEWLESQGERGEKANLSNLDLSYLDLSGINLSRASLYKANLAFITLHNTNFSYADLSCTNLSYTNLVNVDFTYAILSEAVLTDSSLECVNLRFAKLKEANLHSSFIFNSDLTCSDFTNAILKKVNFTNSNLKFADLKGANLHLAKLENAKLTRVLTNPDTLFYHLQCPEEGSYIGYKKCFKNKIVKLLIPEDAKRSSATSRKCRANKVKVLNITDISGKRDYAEAESIRSPYFIYKVGEIIEIEDFDENRWKECSTGIHHFITRDEAVNYEL